MPWSSGHLKYLPGQRNLYKDLVLNKQAEQEQQPQQPPCAINLCKPKEDKKCNDTNKPSLCSDPRPTKKKKKKKSRSKRSSIKSESSGARRSSVQQPPQQQGATNCCCIELEEVYVCDGVGSEPRKGYLVKTCQRPEVIFVTYLLVYNNTIFTKNEGWSFKDTVRAMFLILVFLILTN